METKNIHDIIEDYLATYKDSSRPTIRSHLKISCIANYLENTGENFLCWEYRNISCFMRYGFARDDKGNRLIKSTTNYTYTVRTLAKFFAFATKNVGLSQYFKAREFKKLYFEDTVLYSHLTYGDFEKASARLERSERIYFLTITRFFYLGGSTHMLLSVKEDDFNRETLTIELEGKTLEIDKEMIDLFEAAKQMRKLGNSGTIVPIVPGAVFGLSVRRTECKYPLDIAVKRLMNIYRRLSGKAGIEVNLKNLKLIGILDKISGKYPRYYHMMFRGVDYGKIFSATIRSVAKPYGLTERNFKALYPELRELYLLRNTSQSPRP